MNEGSRRTLEELRSILLIIQNAAFSSGQLLKGEEYLTSNLIALFNNKALDILSFPTQFNINPVDFNLITQAPYITLTYILGIFKSYHLFLNQKDFSTFYFPREKDNSKVVYKIKFYRRKGVALKKENNPSRRKRKGFNSKNFQIEFLKAVSKD